LLAVFAPGRVEHDEAELLGLDQLVEGVAGAGHDRAWRRNVVGVVQGHHVVDDGVSGPVSGVVLELLSVLEDDQGRVALDEVLLSELNLFGDVDFGKEDSMFLQLKSGFGEICKIRMSKENF
jgi:hypothetical protein